MKHYTIVLTPVERRIVANALRERMEDRPDDTECTNDPQGAANLRTIARVLRRLSNNEKGAIAQ